MFRGTLALLLCSSLALACQNPDESEDSKPSFQWASPLVADTLCLSFQVPRGDSASAQETRDKMFTLASAAGVKTVRTDLLWHEIEPEKGDLNYEGYRRVINAAAARNMEVLALLVYGNAWASSDYENENTTPPDDPADFANYARGVAEQFGDRIRHYEIWNEPNAWLRFWITPEAKAEPGRYGVLLEAAAHSIKSVDNDANVIFGGTLFHGQNIFPGTLEFLEESHTAIPTLKDAYDSVAWHPYNIYPPREAPESAKGSELPLPEKWDQLQSTMESIQVADKPVAVSEIGWPVAGPISESMQADYLIRAHLLAVERRSPMSCWYTLRDGIPGSASSLAPEHAFGLVRNDYSPKPAYLALKLLAQTLGEYRFVDRLTTAEGVHALRFSHAKTEAVIWAGWSEQDPTDVELPGIAKPVTLSQTPSYHPVAL